MIKKITSLELYLKFEPESVIDTECLVDNSAGIYPCYYFKSGNGFKVSTSVTSLIIASGAFVLNPNFVPPNFLKKNWRVPKIIPKLAKVFNIPNILENKEYYSVWETIDQRIMKLRPFEGLTLTNRFISFKPRPSISEIERIVTMSAFHLRNFVNNIEKEFPEHVHIVLTGGKDSQLISLVSKVNNENWFIFSGEPNYPLVKSWVAINGIKVKGIFRHANCSEESAEDFKRKVICSDLYSDPRHIRWLPALRRIAESFGRRVIFWGGTMSPPAHFYSGYYRVGINNEVDFFNYHFEETAGWQGNYHQAFKNFVGLPYLSPYHSPEIWEDLYQYIDPHIIKKGMDLRKQIGDKLLGRPVKWINQNPAPAPYRYNLHCDCYNIYKKYITDCLKMKKA